MELFWRDKELDWLLLTRPAAVIARLSFGITRYCASCLGREIYFEASSLEEAKRTTQQWVIGVIDQLKQSLEIL